MTYDEWNESVGRYCFHAGNAGRVIRFAVDPIILQRAAAAEGPWRTHFPTPESAAEDFKAAVTDRIDKKGWGFGEPKQGRIPWGLAKLALQVLAVFEIVAKGPEYGRYWDALNRTLGREETGKPKDLEYSTHQAAWDRLVEWTNDLNGGRLGILPKPDWLAGRRYVRVPLSHGLLRLEDFKSLHLFFESAGLAPGEELESKEVENELPGRVEDLRIFPRKHARRVLGDAARRPLAAVQIVNALAQWDGSALLKLDAERKAHRLWFAISPREEFRIRGGLVEVKSGEASADVPGVTLRDILGGNLVRRLDSPVRYRPIRDRFVLAIKSLLDGRYVERRYFEPGDGILVVWPGRDAGSLKRGLQGIAVKEPVSIRPDPSLRWGDWVVFRLQVREDATNAGLPFELAKCLKAEGTRLKVSGGLRFGVTYLEGAGPTLTVVNGESAKVIVDREEYATVEDRLTPERCPVLGKIGVHEAWLPGRYQGAVRGFRVGRPRMASFDEAALVQAGWTRQSPPAWPTPWRDGEDPIQPRMRGPAVEGDWPPIQPPRPPHAPAARVALELAVALRRPRRYRRSATLALAGANASHPNLLVRQLARAATNDRT